MILSEIKNIKSEPKDLRSFGYTIGLVIFIIWLVLLLNGSMNYPLIAIASLLLLTAKFYPRILLPLQKVWMILSVVLGWFTTRLILGIIFYLLLTSIRLIAKLFGKNFLEQKIDKSKKSYWNYRISKEYSPIDSERQF